MKLISVIGALLFFNSSYSQELDIFQHDSIYYNNGVAVRTMSAVNGNNLQKDLVTHYDAAGRKTKQLWYWNGDQRPHNIETFYYSDDGLLSSIADTTADKAPEITTYYYEDKLLRKRISLAGTDTSDVRHYPSANTTFKRWYTNGKPYRFDTTIFEKENAKLEYYGSEESRQPGSRFRWHYRFKNEFDANGNLIRVSGKVEKPYSSYTRYVYDRNNLLLKKQEIIFVNKKEIIQTEYYFTYEYAYPKKEIKHKALPVAAKAIPIKKDTLTLYFPLKESGQDSITQANSLDTFTNRWYSEMLSTLQEPVLCNYDGNDEIYRFTWLRTFHNPIAIRVEKANANIILAVKVCDGAGGYSPGKLTTNKKIRLTNEQWIRIKQQFAKLNFNKLPAQNNYRGTDGAEWILESSAKGRYHFTTRWSTGGVNREFCLYLLKLSGIKIPAEDIY